ncbi:MAG: glycoside hydrolase family 12 [Rhizobacter sp.]|nr:glycoside hydrolase family 12 [Rhizobacter sp.]
MKLFACVLSALSLALFLSADASLSAEGKPVSAEIGVTTLTCADDAVHPLRLGHLLNNTWNKRLAGGEFWQQCLRSRVRDGRTEFGWSWQWPTRDGIYAYPEVLVGRSPWTETPSNDARFPRRIADIASLRIDYDVESDYRGKRNLAMEMWLTDKPNTSAVPDTRSIVAELMVWSDASKGMVSSQDKPVDIVDIDGSKYALYVKRDWGDASGVVAHRWMFLIYIAVTPSLTAHYDARKFLQDAVDRQLLDARHYVADVELGNEIVSGSGSTWLRRFEVTLDPR